MHHGEDIHDVRTMITNDGTGHEVRLPNHAVIFRFYHDGLLSREIPVRRMWVHVMTRIERYTDFPIRMTVASTIVFVVGFLKVGFEWW